MAVFWQVALVISVLATGSCFLVDECQHYSEYRDLESLLSHDDCRTATSAIVLFRKLYWRDGQNGIRCGEHILSRLAERYSSEERTPSSCFCNGTVHLQRYSYIQNYNNGQYCENTDHYYRVLRDRFFLQSVGNQAPGSHCRSHHSLWYELRNINGRRDSGDSHSHCLTDLVNHVYHHYNQHSDPCSCSDASNDIQRCKQYTSYNKLLKFMDNSDGCVSMNSVWGYLDHQRRVDDGCRIHIQALLTNKYNRTDGVDRSDCGCHGQLHNMDTPRFDGGHIYFCEKFHSYQAIEQRTFTQIQSYGCKSIAEGWPVFAKVQDDNIGCQADFIHRAALHFHSQSDDPCLCQWSHPHLHVTNAPTTAMPTTHAPTTTPMPTSTTTTTTTTTTTPVPVITTQPSFTYGCGKFGVISSIAQETIVNSTKATPCDPLTSSSLGQTNEALILTYCNTPDPPTWQRGVRVMDYCQSIPPYTPIAAFQSDTYSPSGAASGVFLQCESSGFQVVFEPCNGVPAIQHLNTSGAFLFNPYNYYVIA